MAQEIALNFSCDSHKVIVGLAWDPNEQSSGVLGDIKPHNLDLSCVILSEGMKVKDIVSPTDTKRDEYKGQIFHRGDNKSGGSDFEDEDITVDLKGLDDSVAALAFTISTNDRVKISEVANGKCSFMNGTSLEPFMSLDLASLKSNQNNVNASAQEHFVTGVMIKGQDGNWVLKDVQMQIPALEQSSLEEAMKSA